MADTPTPQSYRLPPVSAEGGRTIDPFKEELRDITTLLLELRIQIKQLRNEVEEIKLVEEAKPQKGSLIPPSLKGAVTPKRAVIAAILALLTALPEILEQLQAALDKLSN